jgi:hypothetical protein
LQEWLVASGPWRLGSKFGTQWNGLGRFGAGPFGSATRACFDFGSIVSLDIDRRELRPAPARDGLPLDPELTTRVIESGTFAKWTQAPQRRGRVLMFTHVDPEAGQKQRPDLFPFASG